MSKPSVGRYPLQLSAVFHFREIYSHFSRFLHRDIAACQVECAVHTSILISPLLRWEANGHFINNGHCCLQCKYYAIFIFLCIFWVRWREHFWRKSTHVCFSSLFPGWLMFGIEIVLRDGCQTVVMSFKWSLVWHIRSNESTKTRLKLEALYYMLAMNYFEWSVA